MGTGTKRQILELWLLGYHARSGLNTPGLLISSEREMNFHLVQVLNNFCSQLDLILMNITPKGDVQWTSRSDGSKVGERYEKATYIFEFPMHI